MDAQNLTPKNFGFRKKPAEKKISVKLFSIVFIGNYEKKRSNSTDITVTTL